MWRRVFSSGWSQRHSERGTVTGARCCRLNNGVKYGQVGDYEETLGTKWPKGQNLCKGSSSNPPPQNVSLHLPPKKRSSYSVTESLHPQPEFHQTAAHSLHSACVCLCVAAAGIHFSALRHWLVGRHEECILPWFSSWPPRSPSGCLAEARPGSPHTARERCENEWRWHTTRSVSQTVSQPVSQWVSQPVRPVTDPCESRS